MEIKLNLNIFCLALLISFQDFLKKKKTKKSLSPQAQNMKIIDDLTSKIEEINNIKVTLTKSYRRGLKKERGKSARLSKK